MNINIGEIRSVILPARPIVAPTPPTPPVFGIECDASNIRTIRRTDDSANFSNPEAYVVGSTSYGSPFDDLMPWAGIERVSNADAGELVKIPKFWFKLDTSNGFKLQISNVEVEGFSVAPAFMDRGDGKGERDYAYVGRYHCASNWKSATGVLPKGEVFRDEARVGIHSLGSDIWQIDYAMLETIQMLYLVEYADWDSQSTIGAGCTQTTAPIYETFVMGGTDSMPYHTGTVSAAHNAFGECQYRYIEGLWSNCWDWIEGVYFNDTDIYAIKNPANFSDNFGGTFVGTRPNENAYIKAYAKASVSGFEWFYYPSEWTVIESEAVPDSCDYDSEGYLLSTASGWSQDTYSGLFGLNGMYDNYEPFRSDSMGCRLMYLP